MNLLPSYRISLLNVQSLTPAAAQLYRVANLNSNCLTPRDTIARELWGTREQNCRNSRQPTNGQERVLAPRRLFCQ